MGNTYLLREPHRGFLGVREARDVEAFHEGRAIGFDAPAQRDGAVAIRGDGFARRVLRFDRLREQRVVHEIDARPVPASEVDAVQRVGVFLAELHAVLKRRHRLFVRRELDAIGGVEVARQRALVDWNLPAFDRDDGDVDPRRFQGVVRRRHLFHPRASGHVTHQIGAGADDCDLLGHVEV